jgi:hypothetical protein
MEQTFPVGIANVATPRTSRLGVVLGFRHPSGKLKHQKNISMVATPDGAKVVVPPVAIPDRKSVTMFETDPAQQDYKLLANSPEPQLPHRLTRQIKLGRH